MKILILYFSGAGSTRYVAEQITGQLEQKVNVRSCSFEKPQDMDLTWCDALVVGTPVYHCAPARLIMEYLDSIRLLDEPKPVFVYNTRGLYSCNTNRILAKKLRAKNILTVMDRAYGSPASDGSLITPFVGRFFRFEPKLQEKMRRDCGTFLKILQQDSYHAYIPRFHLSSILNGPNKLAGQLITFRIHLHRDKCSRCGRCVAGCPHRALEKDNEKYPFFVPQRCENCYRCIHHCPEMALSLSKRRAPKKVLHRP